MSRSLLTLALFVAGAVPAFSQMDVNATVTKHLKIAEDFTVKVAEAMPESDYGFKLTPPQMSFGEQMLHLSQALAFILAPLSGEQPAPPSQKPNGKAEIVKYIRDCYDRTISRVSGLTPQQLAKTYQFEGKNMTGFDLLLSLLDHSTQHRASAEMYLRAKGITPPLYEF